MELSRLRGANRSPGRRARCEQVVDDFGYCRYRVAQRVAAAPHGFDVVIAASRLSELLAQLAEKDVDDLELGFVHPAVEVVEKHLLGQRRPFAQAQQFQDGVLLDGQVERLVTNRDTVAVEVDQKLAGADRRFGIALRAPNDRPNARDQLALLEWFGQEVVGAEAEPLDLVVKLIESRKNQDRSAHPGRPQPP